MADVKEPVVETNGEPTPAPQQSEPLQAEGQPATKDENPEAQQERTVPLSALTAERQKWQKRVREMQSEVSKQKPPAYDPSDPNSKEQYVRHLESQVAENQLKDKTRDLLKDYPDLPKSLRKAILRNPLGFCKPGTRDIENGVLDIQEYVEDQLSEIEVTPQLKTVQVAGGNTPATSQSSQSPADIQKILNKSIDEWTPEEIKLVEAYKTSHT
jgi:hypothetical protein